MNIFKSTKINTVTWISNICPGTYTFKGLTGPDYIRPV